MGCIQSFAVKLCCHFFCLVSRSPSDPRLFIVHDHDPEMLSKSFNELSLFSDSSGAYVQVSIYFCFYLSTSWSSLAVPKYGLNWTQHL